MSPPTLTWDWHTSADDLVPHYAARIRGKVVLTTGISPGGVGAYFVQAIARARPAWLVLAGRDAEKARETEGLVHVSANSGLGSQSQSPAEAQAQGQAQGQIQAQEEAQVRVRFVHIDLESQQSVRTAAAQINAWTDIPHIDVLVNNAGITDYTYALTPDGVERHLAANHLGHFLLTNLIMDKLLGGGGGDKPRVINVTSEGHRLSPFRFRDYNFDGGKTYHGLRAYGQSKTANVLFTTSLAEKLGKRGLLALSVHPGPIFTNLVARLNLSQFYADFTEIDRFIGNDEAFMPPIRELKSMAQGTATHVYAAFDPDLAAHNGAYLLDCHVGDPFTETIKSWATSPVEAEKLWRLSEELVGQKFSY